MSIITRLSRTGKHEKIEFVLKLVDRILAGDDIFDDRVLLMDTIEEMYRILRQLALNSKDENLLTAFEKMAILRYSLQTENVFDRKTLSDIKPFLLNTLKERSSTI